MATLSARALQLAKEQAGAQTEPAILRVRHISLLAKRSAYCLPASIELLTGLMWALQQTTAAQPTQLRGRALPPAAVTSFAELWATYHPYTNIRTSTWSLELRHS